MNAKFLIDLLSTLPPDTILQIETYDNSYDPPRITAVNNVQFRAKWEALYEDKVINSQPNRLILS